MIPAPQTLADTLVTQLIDAGIDTVFGIPGLYNMPLFDALRRAEGIRVVTVRHEQGAAFMADGYARATGRPAAICLLPGCGVLNAMTGISEAFFDSSPMLVLASQVATEHIDQDRGLLHELTGQLDVVGSVTKHSVRLTDVESAPAVFADALRRLRTGRPRPVQVEIPLDLQSADVSGRPEPTGPADATGRLDHDLIRRAAANLAAASRPLIYVGGGAVDAASITDIAEHLGAPTFTTGMGVGALPGDHPLWAGVPWVASGDIRPLFEASDCVLFVGTRLNHGMTAEWGIGAPAGSVRIDVDPVEITKTLDVDVQIVADAAAATEALLTELRRLGPAKGPSAEMAALLEQRRAALAGRVGTTTPWFEALRSALPADGIIAADMSLFWGDMIGSFPVAGPRQILFPWGMGTLGFGVPSAIGAQLGRPDAPVVSIVGDGAFQFTGTELGTAVELGLPVAFVVANNAAYGMIQMQQLNKYGADIATDLPGPDFVALARAYGAHGRHITTPDELADALAEAFSAHGPTVIELPWARTFASPVAREVAVDDIS